MPGLSAGIALAGEDSPGRPAGKLGDVACDDVLQPETELSADLGQIPQDVAQFEGQGLAVGVRDLAVPVPEDLLDLSRDLPGLIRQAQRGIDDGMIGGHYGAGPRGRLLIGVEPERSGSVLACHHPSVPGVLPEGARLPDVDQPDQPASQLLQQVMSDVRELTARHGWETTPRRRMAHLLAEALELSEEVLHLPPSGPYDPLLLQRIGREIYDVLWNACDLARLTGINVVQAAADKRAVNATRVWPDS